MGSMTGAPKAEVMKNIRTLESGPRGIYSGTVGYIDPEGDFDLNVVIRSLQYNTETRELKYSAGGAITWDSVPEEEWAEIRLKAEAMEGLFR
jgi:para-aminobenzoate synthetase component 1